MSLDKNLPVFPFTYLKNDLSVKGVQPSFSPGINKFQFFLLLSCFINHTMTLNEITNNLRDFITKNEIAELEPAFPFTTWINEQQVIVPGIFFHELFSFIEENKIIEPVNINELILILFPQINANKDN